MFGAFEDKGRGCVDRSRSGAGRWFYDRTCMELESFEALRHVFGERARLGWYSHVPNGMTQFFPKRSKQRLLVAQ